MYAGEPTGRFQGLEEGQQEHKNICQKNVCSSKNIQMASMERPVSIISYYGFSLLLKLRQIEEVHVLPNWDSLFT